MITPDTLALAKGYVDVKSLGPIPVKGDAEPLEIFELTGAGQARTLLEAAALQGLTRFVGRDAEVEHLCRVLGQAVSGRARREAQVQPLLVVFEDLHWIDGETHSPLDSLVESLGWPACCFW